MERGKTNVRGYTASQLLNRVASLPSFKGFPKDFWLLGVQSNEDEPNVFDDKFYLFKEKRFIMVATGTTNAGTTGLRSYQKYNKNGTFVIKTNEWFYGLWKFGYHRGKMPALKQVRPILGYRDNNRDDKIDEVGKIVKGYYGINFHSVDYGLRPGFWRRLVGLWSVGCQVLNDINQYLSILTKVKNQESVTYCIIKEF